MSTKPWQRVGAQSTGGVSVPNGRLWFTSSEGPVYQQGLLEVCWQWTGHIAEGQVLGCSTVQTHSQVFIPRSDVQPRSRCATEQGRSLEPGAQGYYFRFNQGSMLMKTKGPMRTLMLLALWYYLMLKNLDGSALSPGLLSVCTSWAQSRQHQLGSTQHAGKSPGTDNLPSTSSEMILR